MVVDGAWHHSTKRMQRENEAEEGRPWERNVHACRGRGWRASIAPEMVRRGAVAPIGSLCVACALDRGTTNARPHDGKMRTKSKRGNLGHEVHGSVLRFPLFTTCDKAVSYDDDRRARPLVSTRTHASRLRPFHVPRTAVRPNCTGRRTTSNHTPCDEPHRACFVSSACFFLWFYIVALVFSFFYDIDLPGLLLSNSSVWLHEWKRRRSRRHRTTTERRGTRTRSSVRQEGAEVCKTKWRRLRRRGWEWHVGRRTLHIDGRQRGNEKPTQRGARTKRRMGGNA